MFLKIVVVVSALALIASQGTCQPIDIDDLDTHGFTSYRIKYPVNEIFVVKKPKNGTRTLEFPDNESDTAEYPDSETSTVENSENESNIVEYPDNENNIVEHPDNENNLVEHPDNENNIVEHPDNENNIVEHPDKETELVEYPDNETTGEESESGTNIEGDLPEYSTEKPEASPEIAVHYLRQRNEKTILLIRKKPSKKADAEKTESEAVAATEESMDNEVLSYLPGLLKSKKFSNIADLVLKPETSVSTTTEALMAA